MRQTGFYEQKSIRPGGLALVLALHGAALTALVLVKTEIVRVPGADTIVTFLPDPPPPPDEPQPPQPERPQQPSRMDTTIPIVRTQPEGPVVPDPPLPPLPPSTGEVGPRIELAGTPELPPPPPVRVEAQVDPRYARDLQPPYPPREESAQREGVVRVRVTIGTDGRVKAVQQVSATSDAFWRATEQHARARWRFRPATVDGRPVESTKLMNVYFRIEV